MFQGRHIVQHTHPEKGKAEAQGPDIQLYTDLYYEQASSLPML